jgi:hypothetical protein
MSVDLRAVVRERMYDSVEPPPFFGAFEMVSIHARPVPDDEDDGDDSSWDDDECDSCEQ